MKWKDYYRRYLSFAALFAGLGLLLEHYITYGGTMHFVWLDHGVVGLILIVAGALAGMAQKGKT